METESIKAGRQFRVIGDMMGERTWRCEGCNHTYQHNIEQFECPMGCGGEVRMAPQRLVKT